MYKYTSHIRPAHNHAITRKPSATRLTMFPNDSWMMMVNQSPSPSSSSSWSRHQDKLFERALVVIPEETPDRWDKIAAQVPGKSSSEVRRHYEDLVHDVAEIDSGRVELPLYEDESCGSPWASDSRAGQVSFSPRPRQSESERKKGVPWTEEEHRLGNFPAFHFFSPFPFAFVSENESKVFHENALKNSKS